MKIPPRLLNQAMGSFDDPNRPQYIPAFHSKHGPHGYGSVARSEPDDHHPLWAAVDMHMRRGMLARWSVESNHEAIFPEDRRHRTIT
jgi:hypothetical protein